MRSLCNVSYAFAQSRRVLQLPVFQNTIVFVAGVFSWVKASVRLGSDPHTGQRKERGRMARIIILVHARYHPSKLEQIEGWRRQTSEGTTDQSS
jgi:hypothetical protein